MAVPRLRTGLALPAFGHGLQRRGGRRRGRRRELARGYSREGDPRDHAGEAALAKLPADDPRLATATVYSSLEPCARRTSRPRPRAQLIRDAGVRRVVTAWREPGTFVQGADGAELLEEAGVTVLELAEYAEAAQMPNRHLVGEAPRVSRSGTPQP
ncbi:hypothetical protein [Streptomyces albidoflavus]|uniref:hypothetical protein n=1 Tax=Streptomyces albidoflavus TaxID=1886 RepID=UPI001140F291